LKQVARTTKTPPDTSGNNVAVGAWPNSRALVNDIHRSFVDFRDGKTEPQSARIMVGHFKVAAAVFIMELEHSRLTKRLQDNSATLPMITFETK